MLPFYRCEWYRWTSGADVKPVYLTTWPTTSSLHRSGSTSRRCKHTNPCNVRNWELLRLNTTGSDKAQLNEKSYAILWHIESTFSVTYIQLHVHGGEGRFCADIQASATVNSGAFVRFEILAAEDSNVTVFWDETPYMATRVSVNPICLLLKLWEQLPGFSEAIFLTCRDVRCHIPVEHNLVSFYFCGMYKVL